MPALGRHFQKHLARGGSHGAQLRPHRRRGAAAKRAHVLGSEVGIAHDHCDLVKGNA